MRTIIDLSGQIFGNWTVLEIAKQRNNGVYWVCRCSCGTIKEVHSSSLRKNLSKSCGCMRAVLVSNGNRKHGATINDSEYSYLYATWSGIIDRCTNPKNKIYKYYGAVGIKMCDRWRNSFVDFCLDMGHKPTIKHTLDRYPNKFGDYEKDNCRWATMKEQQNNRTNNTIIKYNGESKTLSEWGAHTSIPAKIISARLKLGWDAKSALTIPVSRSNRRLKKNNQ